MSGVIGSWQVRAATALLALLSAGALFARAGNPDWSRALLVAGIASGVLALLGLLHSFRALYSRWMRIAARIQLVVVTTLFGACYLLIVPFFYLLRAPIDPLRLRRRSKLETFWIRRPEQRIDLESLQRMG